jgi:hypothetical protein
VAPPGRSRARPALAALVLATACSHPIPPPVTVAAAKKTTEKGKPTAKPNPANDDPNYHPPFGPYDVQTVFYISKSNDKDRVDYGLRLDASCAPVGDKAMFPYWRELEHAPPVRSHELKFFQYAGYGFSKRRVLDKTAEGGRYLVQIKHVDRDILIVTKMGKEGYCTATPFTKVQGVKGARLDHIFLKVAGIMSVDYLDIHGADPKTGKALVERMTP